MLHSFLKFASRLRTNAKLFCAAIANKHNYRLGQESSKNKYTLGDNSIEQNRLFSQQFLYGDHQYVEKLVKNTDNVLELGCGPGSNLFIAARCRTYVGVDNSEKQIKKARTRAKEAGLTNVDFIISDAIKLPLEDNDITFSFNRLVLIHLPRPILMLLEMVRLTRPGGTILSIEPNVKKYFSSKTHLNKCFQARCKFAYVINPGTIDVADQLEELYKLAGLVKIRSIKHKVYSDHKESEKLRELQLNMLLMVSTVKDSLIDQGLITKIDYENATREANETNKGDWLEQELNITWGLVLSS